MNYYSVVAAIGIKYQRKVFLAKEIGNTFIDFAKEKIEALGGTLNSVRFVDGYGVIMEYTIPTAYAPEAPLKSIKKATLTRLKEEFYELRSMTSFWVSKHICIVKPEECDIEAECMKFLSSIKKNSLT